MEFVSRPTAAPDAAPAGRRLRVIGKEPLAAVLDIAVSRALRLEMASYDSRRVSAVQDVVKREFQRLLKDNARAIRGIPRSEFLEQLDRSRDQVLEARDRARKELEELSERAALLRTLAGREETVEERGGVFRGSRFEEHLGPRLGAILAEEGLPARERRRRILAAAREEAEAEWARAVEARRSAADDEIGRYERRIAKLTSSLERTESALQRLSKLKEGDGGIASIYRTVQGLAADEGDFEAKRKMLENLFEANVALRRALAEGKTPA